MVTQLLRLDPFLVLFGEDFRSTLSRLYSISYWKAKKLVVPFPFRSTKRMDNPLRQMSIAKEPDRAVFFGRKLS